jgi:hypothetical protein
MMTSKTPLLLRIVSWLLVRNGEPTKLLKRLMVLAMNTPYLHLPGYMGRWYLLQPVKRPEDPGYVAWGWRYWFDKWHAILPFYIRFHLIERADYDRHMHDHPWWFRSIIISGWYSEEYEDQNGVKQVQRFWAGDINSKNPGQYHRIASTSERAVLTLVIHGHRRKDSWGFKVNNQHIPWREYLNIPG